jgi:Na+-driven multidrug efflux pump
MAGAGKSRFPFQRDCILETREGCLDETKPQNRTKATIFKMTPMFAAGGVRELLRESWAMGWPMIFIMFFQFSIGLADIYVAGFLGTRVLAAVGYVGQLYWTLMILAMAITTGCVSMVSQAHGAQSSEGVSNITSQSELFRTDRFEKQQSRSRR